MRAACQMLIVAVFSSLFASPAASTIPLVNPKTVLEIQPFGGQLGDYFPAGTVLADSGYAWGVSYWGATAGDVDVTSFKAQLNTGSYGILHFGTHGGNWNNTSWLAVEWWTNPTAALQRKTDLINTWGFHQDDVAVFNIDGSNFSICLRRAYFDDEPAGSDLAIISACSGDNCGTFNATNRLAGNSATCTNQQFITAYNLLISHMATLAYKKLFDAYEMVTAMMTNAGGNPWTIHGGDLKLFFECDPTVSTASLDYTSVTPAGPAALLPCSAAGSPDANVSPLVYAGGEVQWNTLREEGTSHYVIQGCRDANGAGAAPLAEDASGLGLHVVPVYVGDYPLLRLIEIELGGKQIVRAITTVAAPMAALGASLAQAADTDTARAPALQLEHDSKPGPIRATTTGSGPTIAIYGTANLAGGIAALIEYYESIGETVGGIIFQGDEPNLDDLIKVDIGALSGVHGTARFHLVGSWMFGGSGSDQPYADVDDDGIPDVTVTRWPALTNTGITNMLAKFANYQASAKAQSYPGKAMFLVGDVDVSSNSGAFAKLCSDNVEATLPVGASVSHVLMSEYLDDSSRNIAAADLINSERPDVVTIISTDSNRDAPGRFFSQDQYGYPSLFHPWTMNDLTAGCFVRVVVAASCETVWWYSEDPFPWTPSVAWKFVNSPSRGALAWVGPLGVNPVASYQGVNYVLSFFFQQELWHNPYRSMADSYFVALRQAFAYFAGNEDYLDRLARYEFIGDPLTPFAELPSRTVSARVDNSYDHVLRDAGTAPLVSCPAGDGDKLIVQLELDETKVVPYVSASSVLLTPPPDRTPGVFQEGAEVTFVKGAVEPDDFVFEDGSLFVPGTYRATWTIPNIGGAGADSALVSLFGTPIGWARFTVKSVDTMPLGSSFGVVGLADHAVFSTHYESTICNCIMSKTYSPWCDFLRSFDATHVLPDTTVALHDFSFWAGHFNHAYTTPGNAAASARMRASGEIALALTEDQPLVGQRKLRCTVRMRGVEPFVVMMVALRNENPLFRFGRWEPNADYGGTTMCTQVVRNGRPEIMLGVSSDGTGGIADAVVGYFDIDVLTDDPIVLTEEDFALTLADVLTEGGEEKFFYGNGQSYSRTFLQATYDNGLAQNCPNPFNPETVIAYSVKARVDVQLVIYDVGGRRVRTLVSEPRERGVHRVAWDGRDGTGSPVASGMYFYKLVAGSFVDTKKMLLLK